MSNAGSRLPYGVRLLLTQLGIPFERLEYDTDRGATRTPAFLSTKNPNGRIPVLELEDRRWLAESGAILWYLAEGTGFRPGRRRRRWRWQRAQVLQWMFFEQYSHEPNIATLRNWITHGREMTPGRQAAAPGKRKWGEAALAVMEDHLRARRAGYPWASATQRRLLLRVTHSGEEAGSLAPYPAVRASRARVAASRDTSRSQLSARPPRQPARRSPPALGRPPPRTLAQP